MAYKFQMGQAILSGALEQEGEIKVENEAGSVVGKILQTGVVSGSGQLQGSGVAVDGVITAHRLAVDDGSTIGPDSITDLITLAGGGDITIKDGAYDFDIASHDGSNGLKLGGTLVTSTAAELNYVDVTSAGTVQASKAVVVDGNKDASGFRNLSGSASLTFGALAGTSLALQSGGISAAGAIAGASTIDGTGDLTMGTITMTGFSVDADGDTALKSLAVDDGSTIGPDSVTDLITLAADGGITIKDGAYDFNIAAHDGTNGLKLGGTLVTSTAAELNYVDVASIGTAEASKAVVLDANKDVSGLRDISGRKATLSSLTQGRLVTAGSSGLLEDQAALHYDDARSHGYLELRVSSSASGSAVLGDGYLNLADASENPMFQVSKYDAGDTEEGLFFSDVAAPGADAVATDVILFQDGSDSSRYKKEALGDVRDLFFSAVSGDAVINAGGGLVIQADAVEQSMIADDAVGADQLAANAVVNASIASNAAIDMDKLDGGSLASSLSDLAQGDLLYAGDVDDSNNLKSITFSNFEDAIFGNVSGDATIAAGGALTIAAGAVEHGMLNTNVISGQTDIGADFEITDEILVSDGGTLRKADLSRFATMLAGAGLSAGSGQLSVQGSTVTLRASGDTLAEGYNYFADISSGSVNVTLPGASAPDPGDVVNVKAGDISGGHVLRVSPYANHTIDGQSKIDLESPFAAVSLVYVVSGSWRIV